MPRRVHRPKASEDRIQSKNEFELCYLRHQYFRRVKYNPTESDMKPFAHIARYWSRKTFFIYSKLFYLVGLECEDIINIANVHMVSFIGLFSLENRPEKFEEFSKTFERIHGIKPIHKDILEKNQAIFTLFLKQRMSDVVRVCRQKARNIKGIPFEECYFYCGVKEPPKNRRDLIKNYEKLGFKKLDVAIYKSVKKKAGSIFGSTFKFANHYYVSVPIKQKKLSLSDFTGAGLDPYDSLHNMTPEEMYSLSEDKRLWEKRENEFNEKPNEAKTSIIKNFIINNSKKTELKDEVRTARKLLKELENANTI